MSGIINSAGSRSGVIGTTELDYEEGIWTVTAVDEGGGATFTLDSSYNTGSYVKIGNLVTVQGVIKFDTPSDTGTGNLEIYLPFTSKTGLTDASDDSNLCLGGFDEDWDAWTGKTPYAILNAGTNYFIMRASDGATQAGSGYMSSYVNNDSLLSFSGSYRV